MVLRVELIDSTAIFFLTKDSCSSIKNRFFNFVSFFNVSIFDNILIGRLFQICLLFCLFLVFLLLFLVFTFWFFLLLFFLFFIYFFWVWHSYILKKKIFNIEITCFMVPGNCTKVVHLSLLPDPNIKKKLPLFLEALRTKEL